MLTLTHATLIDGTGAAPVADMDVQIDGGKITAVGHELPIPAGSSVLDLTGKYLIPGLIDAHTHIGGNASLDRPGAAGAFVTYDYAEHREKALNWGVTTVRSANDFMPDIIEFRDKVNAGELRSPRILTAGKAFQADKSHPAFTVYFADPDVLEHDCIMVTEETDLEAEVAKLAEAGVDWIKIFASDDNRFNFPDTLIPTLSVEQIRRIVDAAHKHGLPTMCHVDDPTDMARALEAGVDTIEHVLMVATINHEITPELLDKLVTSGTWVVPTNITLKLLDGSVPGAPLAFEDQMTAVSKMIKAGVKIGVGCDSGVPFIPYGECVHMEMELLVQAGMTNLQALTAATGGNAELLRKADQFGTVKEGLAADLVVLGADPTEDIRNTRDIKLVLREGHIVTDKM